MTTPTETEGEWPKTMRAWTYDQAGAGLEKALYLNDIAAPPPRSALAPDAVLVRVRYMSLNPADYKLAELGLLARPIVAPPAHPGMDFSGHVVLAGERAAATYAPGQRVFGRVDPSRLGTLAEYVLVQNGEGLERAPEGEGADDGGDDDDLMARLAAVGTCGLTALQSIEPYLPTSSSSSSSSSPPKVFINGGSGGTGTFGIQIAKALGCHVTTSCSAGNAELCRGLGADEVLDYRQPGGVAGALQPRGKVFCLVVDNVGASPAGERDLHAAADDFLREDGWFVQVGGGASRAMVAAAARRMLLPGFLGGGRRRWRAVRTLQSHEGLARLGAWIRTGEVKPVVDEIFSFDRAPEAYAKLKTGRTRGKIVVKVSN